MTEAMKVELQELCGFLRSQRDKRLFELRCMLDKVDENEGKLSWHSDLTTLTYEYGRLSGGVNLIVTLLADAERLL